MIEISTGAVSHGVPSSPQTPPAQSSKMPLFAGIGVVVLLAIVGGIIYAMHSSGGNAATPPIQPAPTPTTPAGAPATGDSLVGTWTNTTPMAINGLEKLQIAATGNQLTIEAWGRCVPTDCDWGQQTSTFDGQKAAATFTFNQAKKNSGKEASRVATLNLTPANGALQVTIDSTTEGKAESQHQFSFTHTQ